MSTIADHVEHAYSHLTSGEVKESKTQTILATIAWKLEHAEKRAQEAANKFAATLEQGGTDSVHWGNLDDLLAARAERTAWRFVVYYSDLDYGTPEEALASIKELVIGRLVHYSGPTSSAASQALSATEAEAFRQIARELRLGS